MMNRHSLFLLRGALKGNLTSCKIESSVRKLSCLLFSQQESVL